MKTLILDGTVTVEGNPDPEVKITYRLPWDDETDTLHEAVQKAAERFCREMHAPKWEMRTV